MAIKETEKEAMPIEDFINRPIEANIIPKIKYNSCLFFTARKFTTIQLPIVAKSIYPKKRYSKNDYDSGK
jgi:hypothetical protein